MSIVASTLVHDGLVLGADSMVQITGRDDTGKIAMVQSYQHAQKLYKVSSRIGAATWGIGNVGPRSVGSFIDDYARGLGQRELTVEKVTRGLLETLEEVYKKEFGGVDQTTWPRLGVFVGGYSSGNPLAEEWEFDIPTQNKPVRVRTPETFGASWRGVVDPFTRLYRGIDPRIKAGLLAKGIKEEELDQLTARFIFDGMPIQEAIDFVVFVLNTTVNVSKFEVGISSCGGPLWVSLITRDGFEWIHRPKWRMRRPDENQ